MNILMKRRMCTSHVLETQTAFEIKDMHMESANIWGVVGGKELNADKTLAGENNIWISFHIQTIQFTVLSFLLWENGNWKKVPPRRLFSFPPFSFLFFLNFKVCDDLKKVTKQNCVQYFELNFP